MTRKFIDCRDHPDKSGCTLAFFGEEKELESAVVQHAVSVHGYKDTPELRNQLRSMYKDETTESPTYRATGSRPSSGGGEMRP
ncbi:MAG: DUF1059 domain-containing protein [Myxococcota bacterium]